MALFGHSQIESPSPSPHPPEITIVNSVQGQSRTTYELCKPFPLLYFVFYQAEEPVRAAEPALDTIPPATPGEGSAEEVGGGVAQQMSTIRQKRGVLDSSRAFLPQPGTVTCWAESAGQDPAEAAAAIAAPVCSCKMTSSENAIG